MPLSESLMSFIRSRYGEAIQYIADSGREGPTVVLISGRAVRLSDVEREYKEASQIGLRTETDPLESQLIHKRMEKLGRVYQIPPIAYKSPLKNSDVVKVSGDGSTNDSFFSASIFSEELFKVVEKELNGKEEKPMKEIRTKKIVDRFYHEAEYAIEKELKEEVERLCNEDPNVKLFIKKNREVGDLLKQFAEKDGASINWYVEYTGVSYLRRIVTERTKVFIEEAERASKKASLDCCCEKEKVLDILSACDTYEQECRILVAYGIIDESGKMKSYEV